MDLYVLNDAGEPVRERDLMRWGIWYETHDRFVARDQIGSIRVSTVFLGIDHSFGLPPGPPILWETMIFGGQHDGWTERYSSGADALVGHKRAAFMVRDLVVSDVTNAEK